MLLMGDLYEKATEECYDLIENMTAHHNNWDTSAHRGESSSSITSSSEIAALTQQMTNEKRYTTDVPMVLQERPQGGLPSHTIPNPREEIKVITTQSGITLAGPSVPPPPPSFFLLSRWNKTQRRSRTRSSELPLTPASRSSKLHPSPASRSFELPKRNPHQPPIPNHSRLNKDKLQDKSDIQIHKFLQMLKKLYFNISLAEALALMPKYAKMLKDLLSNKEKLLELANTPLTESCLEVLLKKLPGKLGDPGKFLIPCDYSKLEECMALADLGSSINLMPLSVWKKLMLLELVPTHITLELANWYVAYQAGIAEDVFVQVGQFTFPADFVVVDYGVNPHVPLILGRPFLRTTCALVDVYGEELILRDDDEKLIFHADSTSKYPHKHRDESINMINLIDITCEDHFHEVLKIQKSIHPFSGSTTSPSDSFPSLTPFKTSDSLLEEFTDELALIESFPARNEDIHSDAKSDLKELEYFLNRDPLIDSSLKDNIEEIDFILDEFVDEPSLVDSFPSEKYDDLFDFENDNDE
nr:reverse transcriptase domain-containing protein [Tanacetum cinerariifolium]